MNADPQSIQPPFHLVNVTWGAGHTQLFLDVSLPSQLAPGNLPALAAHPGVRYRIFTTAADAETIRASSAYQRLVEVVPTEIHLIEVPPGAVSWELLTRCQKTAIADAAAEGAALVFLAPDTVFSDGSFASLARLVAQGKRAVLAAGVRLERESFVPAFLAQFRPQGEPAAVVPPRALVALATRHWHPITHSLMWPPHTVWPSHLYWSAGEEGLLARCFHLHPILVYPQDRRIAFSSTIDDDYVQTACADPEAVHLVTDSDELMVLEISPRDYAMGQQDAEFSAREVARWALVHANGLHRRMFGEVIRFHRGFAAGMRGWVEAEERAASDLEEVEQRLQGLVIPLFFAIVVRPLRALLAPLYRYPLVRRLMRPIRWRVDRAIRVVSDTMAAIAQRWSWYDRRRQATLMWWSLRQRWRQRKQELARRWVPRIGWTWLLIKSRTAILVDRATRVARRYLLHMPRRVLLLARQRWHAAESPGEPGMLPLPPGLTQVETHASPPRPHLDFDPHSPQHATSGAIPRPTDTPHGVPRTDHSDAA